MAQVTVLSQVLQLLPRDSFNRVVKKHQSNKHSKGISTWDHLVSMLYSHIADAQSVRDIRNGLRSTLGDRKHLGVGRVPCKSSLSYLNKHRDGGSLRTTILSCTISYGSRGCLVGCT